MWYDNVISKGVEPVRWLLVALIAYTLATVIWSFFDTPAAPMVAPEPATSQPATTRRPPVNVNWILAKHLFGEAGAVPVEQASNDEPAVQTRLPLELQSVFVADETSESAAIVAQRGKPGKLYAVGDMLPGNAKLIEVFTDRIILRRAGSRETLMFPKSQSQFMAEPIDLEEDQPVMVERGSDTSTDNLSPGEKPGAAAVQDPSANTDPMQLVESYRQKLADDAAGTLDELGLETVDAAAGGGYRIGSVAQSSYLQQTGLQPGDVILSVNGRPVGDIQQDQMELANIMAQGSARIEVQRGSRRFFITASLGDMQ